MKRLLSAGMFLWALLAVAFAQDTKISALASGSPPQATDAIPIARAGANYRLPGSDFLTSNGTEYAGTLPLFISHAANPTTQLFKLDSGDAYGDFGIVETEDANAGDGARPNKVYEIGYNNKGGGNRWVAGEPAVSLNFESYYAPDASRYVEGHLQYIHTDGTVWRPFSFQANRGNTNRYAFFSANTFSFLNTSGNVRFQMDNVQFVLGDTAYPPSIILAPNANTCTDDAPSYTFADDTNTGICTPAAGTISLMSDGEEVVKVHGTTVEMIAGATMGSSSKAISDNSATAFVRIAIPQTAGSNYAGGNLFYTIHCRDASNRATQQGAVSFACQNLAGTESCGFDTPYGVTLGDGTASIAAPLFTAAGGTDTVDISVQSNCTGVTPSNLAIEYRVDMRHVNTVTPQ